MPQSLRQVLLHGISAVLSSNESANGFASVLISRAAAKRAHIKAGRGQSVVIGRGTLSGIQSGRATMHWHLSHAITAKLSNLKHVKLTIRLTLISATGQRVGLAIAGSY